MSNALSRLLGGTIYQQQGENFCVVRAVNCFKITFNGKLCFLESFWKLWSRLYPLNHRFKSSILRLSLQPLYMESAVCPEYNTFQTLNEALLSKPRDIQKGVKITVRKSNVTPEMSLIINIYIHKVNLMISYLRYGILYNSCHLRWN